MAWKLSLVWTTESERQLMYMRNTFPVEEENDERKEQEMSF